MPRVTAIEPQKRNKDRVNVHLDGEFAFGVELSVLAAQRLVEGSELAPEDIERLRADDDVELAYSNALRFLGYRPRSLREVQGYLRRKGTDEVVAAAVIERLRSIALIDDSEFARYWIENRQTFRPRGKRALNAELRQKGVDTETIDAALAGLGDEEEPAYVAGGKRLRSFASLSGDEFERKMLAFLQRRGFPYDVARRATSRLLAER